MLPDIVIRVLRKHWLSITNKSNDFIIDFKKILGQGSYEPGRATSYYNPVFDGYDDGSVIGRKITERKASDTTVHC